MKILPVSWSFLILLMLCSLELCRSQNISYIKSLRTQLLTTNDYDTRFRPLQDQADIIEVSVDLELININEINDLEETMTVTAYIRVTWMDEELTWTPTNYGNINKFFLPQKDIWTPDIAVKNFYGKSETIGFDSLTAKIVSSGQVIWVPYQQFLSTCTLNIRKYPFDEQTCDLILTSWSYTVFQMTFSNDSTIADEYCAENPSWKLKSTSMTLNSSRLYSPELVYTLTLERKPTYIVLTVICPVFLLAILNLFVFLVPASSGGKCGYAVTVFLSLAVVLTIVDGVMPNNAETVPIFTLYVITLIVNSTNITLISIVLEKCVTYDDRCVPVPKILKILTRSFDCKCCTKAKSQVHVEEFDVNIKEKKAFSDKDQSTDCEKEQTWADVVNSIDRFLFFLFSFFYTITTIIFAVLITT